MQMKNGSWHVDTVAFLHAPEYEMVERVEGGVRAREVSEERNKETTDHWPQFLCSVSVCLCRLYES